MELKIFRSCWEFLGVAHLQNKTLISWGFALEVGNLGSTLIRAELGNMKLPSGDGNWFHDAKPGRLDPVLYDDLGFFFYPCLIIQSSSKNLLSLFWSSHLKSEFLLNGLIFTPRPKAKYSWRWRNDAFLWRNWAAWPAFWVPRRFVLVTSRM